MKRVLVTPPTSEPLTTVEMKKHLRVIHSEDDALIASLITAARKKAEQVMNRQLMPATYELYFDAACDEIALLMPPFISLDSFQSYDGSAWSDVTDYVIDDKATPAKVYVADWPTIDTSENAKNVIKLRYRAGYADATSVPDGIKAWMRIEVEKMYDEEKPRIDVDALLDSYRVVPV